jgi:hypothetical protein
LSGCGVDFTTTGGSPSKGTPFRRQKSHSHDGDRALTALAFFGMRSGMKKLFVICLFFGVFGLWTKAEEKEQTEKSNLIHIAADVGEIARGSIELCEE